MNIQPINPGRTFNIGNPEHLIQIQHKNDHIDIVDHLDKGTRPAPLHIVTRVNRDETISYEYE